MSGIALPIRSLASLLSVAVLLGLAGTGMAQSSTQSSRSRAEAMRKHKEAMQKHEATMAKQRAKMQKFKSSKKRMSFHQEQRMKRPKSSPVGNGSRVNSNFSRGGSNSVVGMSKRSSNSKNTSTNRYKPKQVAFNSSNAQSPVNTLKTFKKNANNAGSFKSVLSHFSETQRSNYEAADNWGSKRAKDRLKFHQDLLNSIVRYDDVRVDGNTAYVDVVRKRGNYNTGTVTLKGEGNSWRFHAYKDKMTYNYLPAKSKKKGSKKKSSKSSSKK